MQRSYLGLAALLLAAVACSDNGKTGEQDPAPKAKGQPVLTYYTIPG